MKFYLPNKKVRGIFVFICLLNLPLFGHETLTDEEPVNFQERPLAEVLLEMEEKYQVFFNYQSKLIKDKTVDFNFDTAEKVENALGRLLQDTGLRYELVTEKYIILYEDTRRGNKGAKKVRKRIRQINKLERTGRISIQRNQPDGEVRAKDILDAVSRFQQDKTISGTVTDEEGLPLVGATLLAKGSSIGTITDIEGNYQMTVPDEVQVLVVSYLGYTTLEVPINNQTVVDVILRKDFAQLEEVVVVGYGTQRRRDVTGAISTIKTEDVQRAVTASAEELFQGRISGVSVSQSSNAPGGGITVRVRGTSSISGGNDPLYVIDGVPIANSDQQSLRNSGLRFAAGNNLSPLALLNPQDIESIEVLKDASATAIYGARGANGVVLITTKKGKAGDSKVEVSTSFGLQEVSRIPDLLNAGQFVALNDEARQNDNRDLVFNGNVPPFDTDWQDELFRTAAVQNHSLGFRGGKDATTYALSFGYFNQEGAVIGTGLERYSARLNLENQVNSWLRIGINGNFTRVIQDNSDVSGNNSVIRTVNEMVPIAPVRLGNEWFANADMIVEDYQFGLEAANISSRSNPIFSSDIIKNRGQDDRVLGSVFGEISFTDNLKFRTTVGTDIVNGRLFYFVPTTAVTTNAALNRYYNSTHWSVQNQLTYQTNLGQHGITATVVQSSERYRYDRIETLAENISDGTENFNYDGDTRLTNDKFPTAENWSIASFLGRINYDYGGKYLLSASFRYDGSSRFGEDRRWGFFPAVSAGWIISQEDFFKFKPVTFLKFRAGWGVNGSQDIDAFLYESLIRGTRAVISNNLFAGVEPANIPNPELGWESTRQLNFGLDAGLFDDRITLAFNVYDKLTTDLLFNTNLPLTSGHSNIVLNIGEVSNRGWEVELGAYVLRGKFNWETSINYSLNNNNIEQLDGIVDEVIQNNSVLRPGLPLNTIFGYQTNGLWQTADDIPSGPMPGAQPGDRRFVDINNDNVINADDRVVLGSSIPESTYGINNTFSYKGFQLNVFLQGLGGLRKFNGLLAAVENTTGTENASTRVLDRWTPTNNDTQIQRATQAGRQNVPPNANINSYFVEDASFWRLKNVTLAYSLPQSFLGRLPISSARLALTGQNLATFTNFTIADPEAGQNEGAFPLVRSFTLALNVGF